VPATSTSTALASVFVRSQSVSEYPYLLMSVCAEREVSAAAESRRLHAVVRRPLGFAIFSEHPRRVEC
jgi:hypothetical protein